MANVGYAEIQQIVREEGSQVLDASLEELFVEPRETEDDFLSDWRWHVGSQAELFRVTRFGDIFLKTPDGHIHWLDTGSGVYEEVATDRESWLRILSMNLPTFFHASTLLNFRSLDASPQEGEVYSWIQPPMFGGEEAVENFDIVSAVVHIVSSGRAAKNALTEGRGSADTEPVDETIYTVVINSEKQYSMWPSEKPIPSGWESAGKTGTEQECLDYIEKVWVDMRPENLRKKMEVKRKEIRNNRSVI